MGIKLKKEGIKETVTVRDEVQAAAFLKVGFEPASKADREKLSGVQEETVVDPSVVVDPPVEQ